MPTYVYRREDGSTFEIEQRITEDALKVCPETGQPVTRVITGSAGLIFKGSGFYLTDYARKNAGGGGASKAEESKPKPASEGSSSKESTTSSSDKKASSDTKAA